MQILAVLTMLALGMAQTATAQTAGRSSAAAAAALRSSCKADYSAHCVGNDPSAPIAAACLAQFYVNLSKGCQAALNAYSRPAPEPTDE